MKYLQALWTVPLVLSAPLFEQNMKAPSSQYNRWIVGTYNFYAIQANSKLVHHRPLVTDKNAIFVDVNPRSNSTGLDFQLWIDGSAVEVQSQRLLTKNNTDLSLNGDATNSSNTPGWGVMNGHLTYADNNGQPDDFFVTCPDENYRVYSVVDGGFWCHNAIPIAIHASKIE